MPPFLHSLVPILTTPIMSKQLSRVVSLLLEESFGELVKTVGLHLMRHGATSLSEILLGTKLKTTEVFFLYEVLILQNKR